MLILFLWLMIIVQNDLINECTDIAQGTDVAFRWGIWTTDHGDNLTPQEANTRSSSFDDVMVNSLTHFISQSVRKLGATTLSQRYSGSLLRSVRSFSPNLHLWAANRFFAVLMALFSVIAFSYAQQESALVSGAKRDRLPETYAPAYASGSGADSTANLPEVEYYAPPPGYPPPFDKSLPAYSNDDAYKKDLDPVKNAEDPFADFEDHPPR